jgi:hypothetical protein
MLNDLVWNYTKVEYRNDSCLIRGASCRQVRIAVTDALFLLK